MKNRKILKSALALTLIIITLFTTSFGSLAATANTDKYKESGFVNTYKRTGKEIIGKDSFGSYYNETKKTDAISSLGGFKSSITRYYEDTKNGYVYIYIVTPVKHKKGVKDTLVKGVEFTQQEIESWTDTTTLNAELQCGVSKNECNAAIKSGITNSTKVNKKTTNTLKGVYNISKNDKTGYYGFRLMIPCHKVMRVTISGNYWTKTNTATKSYIYFPYGVSVVQTVYSSNGTSGWKAV